MYSVGVDIGGMSVKIGIVDNGNIIAKKVIKPNANPQTEFIKIIANTVNDLIVETKINKSEINKKRTNRPRAAETKRETAQV